MRKESRFKNLGEASLSLSTVPIGMEKLTITDFYCLAKAIQVIINSDSTEAGFQNVRERIFSSATGLPAERMTSTFMRLNGKDFTHVQAFVQGSALEVNHSPIVTCHINAKCIKFQLYQSCGNGQKKDNKVWSFHCFSDLVRAHPGAMKKGFKMILSIPGSGHFDVLRVVDPSLSVTIPPPQ